MFYDTASNAHGLTHDPFYALVVPRPIAWISTLSKSGIANLAPYSFYNAFSHNPHYVAFGSSGKKHSLTNIEETGEFVVNMPSFSLHDAMNVSSLTTDEDEFVLAGIEKASCRLVKPPRVAASPVSMECKYYQTVPLPNDEGVVGDYMVIGRVVGIHIADEFIKDGRVDTAAMAPISRLGYAEYATVENIWRMRRP